MLWKCCTQYASTFGKLSSGHRTGKGQFSFQSQRKAMAKNAQTTIALVSHTSKVMLKMMVQWVKCLPTMQETRVRSLGWEDPLEKEMATHSSTLAWKIPWTEKPGRLQSMGSQRVRHDWGTFLSFPKLSRPGFSSMWTMNFQMFKLVLEKVKEPEITLPISAGTWKKPESSREKSISALLTMPKPLCGSQQTVENSERDGKTRPPDLPLEKSVCRSGSNS